MAVPARVPAARRFARIQRAPGSDRAAIAPHQDGPYAAIDTCLQQEMTQSGYPGASMAIAMDGKLVHASAFGVRRRGAPEQVDTSTIFRINSTTKMMGAAARCSSSSRGGLICMRRSRSAFRSCPSPSLGRPAT
ncbi:MAG: serine hydrolase [Ardenticatenia bacterium]|nr:serine hydrolase [Ardenticatenia bacterium]